MIFSSVLAARSADGFVYVSIFTQESSLSGCKSGLERVIVVHKVVGKGAFRRQESNRSFFSVRYLCNGGVDRYLLQ